MAVRKSHKIANRIYVTTDYSAFVKDADNREVRLMTRKRLLDSMKKYGCMSEFPIVVTECRDTGKLIIKDGQHRFESAKRLGLPVH